MEICETGEAFVEKDDDLVFDHTKIILKGADDEFFYAKTNSREHQIPQIDVNSLDISRIPADHIWPLADSTFTRAPDPLPSTSYLKRPSLLYYEDTHDTSEYSHQILTEIEACEILRRNPHPNIAQYLGCLVKDGRVRGLCFTRYSITLAQLLRDGTDFNKSHCLLGIKAGVRHLHDLGLVHNDLNPSNIMMHGDDAVIIDFDSCKREGEELGLKRWTVGWALDNQDYARRENDVYSFSKIEEALLEDASSPAQTPT
ncbi:protein kinase domain-containing protein [Trichoderma breve]|uniref:Protein kinase domain-containing protein n=1 Tax=Trichoderma breve TaxID=2034170 RepID=A0A9W9ECC7_9HYPO|nr:protein kinase domain-containing protein [Trichoderma breve]KAJ4864110.1 protein kinase domain-containing protein [Trichoderma breve]